MEQSTAAYRLLMSADLNSLKKEMKNDLQNIKETLKAVENNRSDDRNDLDAENHTDVEREQAVLDENNVTAEYRHTPVEKRWREVIEQWELGCPEKN